MLRVAIIFCVADPFWAYGHVKRVTVYQPEWGGAGVGADVDLPPLFPVKQIL